MIIGYLDEYRGYFGSIEYEPEDKLHYGSLLNIDDFVSYHADNIIDLEKQFHNAVDDYIEFCKEVGKELPWIHASIGEMRWENVQSMFWMYE